MTVTLFVVSEATLDPWSAAPLHHLQLSQSVRSATGFTTHRTIDIFTALLVLLLNPLLQEVDAELEAEVLLLQVIQVLRQSTVTVRHDRQRAPTPLDMSVYRSKIKSSIRPYHRGDTESMLEDSGCPGLSLCESLVTVRHATSCSKTAYRPNKTNYLQIGIPASSRPPGYHLEN